MRIKARKLLIETFGMFEKITDVERKSMRNREMENSNETQSSNFAKIGRLLKCTRDELANWRVLIKHTEFQILNFSFLEGEQNYHKRVYSFENFDAVKLTKTFGRYGKSKRKRSCVLSDLLERLSREDLQRESSKERLPKETYKNRVTLSTSSELELWFLH